MDLPWKFDQLWKNLATSLMAGNEGLGIFQDRNGLTLAHMQRTLAGIQVGHFEQLPLEAANMGDLTLALQKIVVDWHLESCPVALAVSADLGFCRQVVLPRATLENLAQVMAYELDRFLPLSAEQLYYDFQVQEQTATEVHLMLMALPRIRIEEYMHLLTEAGLRPVSVQLAPVAACNAFAGLGRPMPDSWLLLHLAAGSYELLHLRDGVAQGYFRGGDLKKSELSKAILAHIDQICADGPKPKVLGLYGSHVADFKLGALQQHDLEIIQPNHFPLAGLSPETTFDAALPSIGAALTCLGKVVLGINLLPPTERAPVKFGKFSTTAILLAVFLGVFILWGGSALIHTPLELYRVNRQIAKLSPEAKKVESLLQESRGLASQMENLRKIGNSPDKLKILLDLTRLVPDNTWIINLSLSKQYLDMDGMSHSASDLIPLLDKSGWLKKAEFASPIVTDANKLEHFRIKGESKGLSTGP
jgi:general secretion pathway protein L